MMVHDLDISPIFYQAIADGIKNFEIRDNSYRGFQSGDTVILNEFMPYEDPSDESGPGQWSGRKIMAKISYVTNLHQRKNYVVFGLACINEQLPV